MNLITWRKEGKEIMENNGKLFGEKVFSNIAKVIVGKEQTARLLLTALLADGHVLLEDVPGTGKTKPHILRLKHDELFSNGIHLPAGVGIAAFSAFFVHYLGVRDWDEHYIIALIAAIALYFVIYYIDHYLHFLAVNESSAGFLPAKEMFRSGLGLVLGFTVLGAGILVLSSRVAWMSGILRLIKALLLRFLRFLFSGKGEEPAEEIEIPIIEERQNDMGEMPLPEATEPFWLWKVLEVIAIIVFAGLICALAVLFLIKLFRLIRQYLNLHFRQERSVETGGTYDLREKCELEHSPERTRHSLFTALAPHERIRRLYKKKLLSSASRLSEEDRNRMDIYTAKEWEKKLETRGMSDLYEQARYSNREMTAADVKRMKEVCKEMPPNNLRKSVAVSTDFIRFTLNKMRRLFSGSS